jgi:hypothetical protein
MARQCVNRCTYCKRILNPPLGIRPSYGKTVGGRLTAGGSILKQDSGAAAVSNILSLCTYSSCATGRHSLLFASPAFHFSL